MAAHFNLSGRIGQVHENRFSVAVDTSYKNKDGEYVDRTDWYTIFFIESQKAYVDAYARPGNIVTVSGSISSRQDDDKRTNNYFQLGFMNGISVLQWRKNEDGDKKPRKKKESPPEDDWDSEEW